VAVHDALVVGHVMVSYVELHDGSEVRRITSLSPLAVDPDVHARGIGSTLVRAVLERVDDAREPLVVIEGDPRYYGRLGFEWAPEHGISITLPDWAPAEAAQVYRLASYEPTIRGHVVYPPAFGGVTDH